MERTPARLLSITAHGLSVSLAGSRARVQGLLRAERLSFNALHHSRGFLGYLATADWLASSGLRCTGVLEMCRTETGSGTPVFWDSDAFPSLADTECRYRAMSQPGNSCHLGNHEFMHVPLNNYAKNGTVYKRQEIKFLSNYFSITIILLC